MYVQTYVRIISKITFWKFWTEFHWKIFYIHIMFLSHGCVGEFWTGTHVCRIVPMYVEFVPLCRIAPCSFRTYLVGLSRCTLTYVVRRITLTYKSTYTSIELCYLIYLCRCTYDWRPGVNMAVYTHTDTHVQGCL